MNQYSEYLKMPGCMEFSVMQQIHEEMLAEIGTDEEAIDLYQRLLDKSIRYTGIRAEWSKMSKEEKMNQDSSRTSAHNSVIIHFDMLARYLRNQGKPAAWRDILGPVDQDHPDNRKKIGDMANYLVFVEAVTHR